MKDILRDRTKKIKSDNYSESQNISSSVPQGSELGPLLFLIFISDLHQDIKSEIKLHIDIKLLFKLSSWVDIWILKFNIEKCQGLHIGCKYINVEYKLINREIKLVNEKSDLEVGFDYTLKADNHILSTISRAKGIIGWMVRNFISRETNVILTLGL